MLLCLDTSLRSSVAVVDSGGAVLSVGESDRPRGHAETIGVLMRETLDRAGVTPSQITAVVTGMGPGPFTGLRIGIAAGRAFAVARGIPEYSLVSHDAVALAAGEDRPERRLGVITDARRREAAVTVYSGVVNGVPQRSAEPLLMPHGEGGVADIAGLAADVTWIVAESIDAGALGTVAARRLVAGIGPDPAQALYLRAPDAVVPAPRKRVTA